MFRPRDPTDVVIRIERETLVAVSSGQELRRMRFKNFFFPSTSVHTRNPSSLIKIVDVPPWRA